MTSFRADESGEVALGTEHDDSRGEIHSQETHHELGYAER